MILTGHKKITPFEYGLVLGSGCMLQGETLQPFYAEEAMNQNIRWDVSEAEAAEEIKRTSNNDAFFMIGNKQGVFLPNRGYKGIMTIGEYMINSPFPMFAFERLGAALPDPVTIKQFRVAANV